MALSAALQFRVGQGQVSDISQSEIRARFAICIIFSLVSLVLILGLAVYSNMCVKLLEPKELEGSQIILSGKGKALSLERCVVAPLVKTSAIWPLNTVTVLVDGPIRAYISLDLLEEIAQLALLDKWSKVRGVLPLRAQEYQDKVTPR